MRKILLLSILMLCTLSLFATAYKSNSLGQGLEEIEALTGIGWEREDIDNDITIYNDGAIVQSKHMLSDGYEIARNGQKERVFVDDSGRITRRSISTAESTEEYNYFYTDTRLTSYTYSLNGELVKKIDYIFSGNALSAMAGTDRAYFLNDSLVYNGANGGVFVNTIDLKESDDILERGGYVQLENGNLREEKDGIVFIYNSLGRLESEERTGYKITYIYSKEGSLERKVTEKGDLLELEEYLDSNLNKTVFYENGTIKRERTVLETGEIEEIRYISGMPRYRLIFDIDGRRLKEVMPL